MPPFVKSNPISRDIAESNDASSLFSTFGTIGNTVQYQELIRQDAAYSASRRWPLLAELLGVHAAESDPS